uniref:Uncharacterized protein n=1 Tax=Arundo donax TaxID=35708 RepID=A0A0A8XNG2_ARUDO
MWRQIWPSPSTTVTSTMAVGGGDGSLLLLAPLDGGGVIGVSVYLFFTGG